MNLSKFLGRVVEAAAVHLTAGAVARATETGLEHGEEAIRRARVAITNFRERNTKTNTPPVEEPKKGDSTKKSI